MREPQFVEHVCALLAEQGIPPAAICLELTEGTLMADLGETGQGYYFHRPLSTATFEKLLQTA